MINKSGWLMIIGIWVIIFGAYLNNVLLAIIGLSIAIIALYINKDNPMPWV